jgi:glycosyltransferase involved in cell wall biosynthesis
MVRREDPLLESNLEHGFPAELPVGGGNVSFVSGWAFHRRRRIAELVVRIDGGPPGKAIFPMPRGDVYREYRALRRSAQYAYRSGFWAFVPAVPNGTDEVDAELIAILSNGDISTRSLGRLRLMPHEEVDSSGTPTPGDATDEPLIAICMATFNPSPDLLRRQIESIRAQTHRNWICMVSDDRSRPDRFEMLRAAVDGDPRWHLSQPPRRLGFYRNFERALGLVPRDVRLVALADQDDRWHPEKLAALRDRLGEKELLAYCDMRVVSEDGEVLSPTIFRRRRGNHTNLASLMIGNTVTGAASLMKRELLDLALPFPQPLGHDFHDQWLASMALAVGRIAHVHRPLQDYVQHGDNAFGADRADPAREDRRRRTLRANRLAVSEMLLRWRHEYFVYACPVQLRAKVLELRAGPRLRGRKRRMARRLARLDGSVRSLAVVLWLYLRSVAAGPRRLASAGNERLLVRGVLWRWLVRIQASFRRRRLEAHRQALPVPQPPTIRSAVAEKPLAARQIPEKIRPIPLEVREEAHERVNMLIPTIDLEHFFGAYIGKFNLARRLSELGMHVRLVAIDPTELPADWRQRVEAYEGLDGMFDRVEVVYAPTRETLRLEVSPSDRFIATTSWTAHVAHRACSDLGRRRFLFIIQEYDALTYPVGTLGAVVREAYRLPHVAAFSTELLRDYFRRHRLGVYAASEGDRLSATFRNAITRVDPPAPGDLAGTRSRLLFYARPEEHAERNLFELGLLALSEAIRRGVLPKEWEFVGIGSQEPQTLELAPGADLQILPRMSQEDYRTLLTQYSIGLALMDTPHPSLVPLEMASAGLLVVTSTFENKTRDVIRSISPNLIAAEPTVDAVVEGLAQARALEANHERRAAGASLDWPRGWDESFDRDTVAHIARLLQQT